MDKVIIVFKDDKEEPVFTKKVKTCKGHLDDVPEHFKDNDYIKTGYRLHYVGFKEIFGTMFMCHNETFNVWSHFAAKLMFLGFIAFICISNPSYESMAMDGNNG
jgi:hypothetical protein